MNSYPSKNLNPSKNPKSLFALDAYGYDLPEGLIAQHPSLERDQARLMVVDRSSGEIKHDIFANIGLYLPPTSSIVINTSKVIPARLLGHKKKTGGEVEIFLLKALDDGYHFEALLRPLKKIPLMEPMDFGHGIEAVLVDKEARIVRFNKKDVITHLKEVGHIPLPPYIKRDDDEADKRDYQTVYAKEFGSVAAPTAGLHFTSELMDKLTKQGHDFLELTLHINYGTFKPVECDDIREHPMHSEPYVIDRSVYDQVCLAKVRGVPVVAVGTTSCRVLESVALTGQTVGETDIFMYPGFDFKNTDVLITNFHLPYSTLLMLVCAFGGYDLIMKAYTEAIKEQYRFFSYGDAMIIR